MNAAIGISELRSLFVSTKFYISLGKVHLRLHLFGPTIPTSTASTTSPQMYRYGLRKAVDLNKVKAMKKKKKQKLPVEV